MKSRNKQLAPQEKRNAEAAQEKLLRSVLDLTKRPDAPASFRRTIDSILSKILSNKREAL